MTAIEHRGPDAEGFLREVVGSGFLIVGFRRLAILDRSTLADQPQTSSDGRFEIIFNGEIYNYIELRKELIDLGFTFRTDGDTEVLLSAWQAWGQAALQKLVGMFSFVILDRKSKELICVRDPFGIKPFFYSSSRSGFVFASEIEALRRISSEGFSPNIKICQQYLILGNYDRGQETFFDGIYSLKPGHMMRIDCTAAHQVTEQIKWTTIDDSQPLNCNFDEAVEILREEFLQSVRLHLRSDVKIATALSGGLDSSALVGAIRYLEPDLEIDTFSYISQSARIDESSWINEVNRVCKGRAHFITIDKQQFYRDLDNLILCQGEPFGSTSIYAQYRVFQEASSVGIKVMLDGQGSDELFAGYFGFPENRLRSLLETNQFSKAISLLSEWKKFPDRVLSQPIKSYLKDSNPFGLVTLDSPALILTIN
jgi:asparagine synthase (glutamine-hydrolysing)